MKIVGLWSGHDSSYCVLEDGFVTQHVELERHLREKEPAGDSAELFSNLNGDFKDAICATTVHKSDRLTSQQGWNKFKGIDLFVYGHHQSHAANAFYSSNFENAVVLTIDGGGIENDNETASITIWKGCGTKLDKLLSISDGDLNIGGVWTRTTRYVFRYESGWPQGHQAGTVMALSALGDPSVWRSEVAKWFLEDHAKVLSTPVGHIKGMSAKDPLSPKHDYLKRFEDIAQSSDQEKYNLAASLQEATENYIYGLVKKSLELYPGVENICISGGVALNSVAMGKIWEKFPELKGIYIPPVPYDGGLCIGSAQYHWHNVLGNPRIKWENNASPYLGISYTRDAVEKAIEKYKDVDVRHDIDDNLVSDLLLQGNIVSVYNRKAESGRRALGNRSILADPRNKDMKDRVNHKVKHRQWFRPFAPSILREEVSAWFVRDVDSPYMGFVVPFREESKDKVPAVVHFDGTARLQTVTEKDNSWYYSFLKTWHQKSGVPILLNTSFNDREPICETPENALKCFYETDIDFLYFPEYRILVSKNKNTP
jgi:carbamoyltransferase